MRRNCISCFSIASTASGDETFRLLAAKDKLLGRPVILHSGLLLNRVNKLKVSKSVANGKSKDFSIKD